MARGKTKEEKLQALQEEVADEEEFFAAEDDSSHDEEDVDEGAELPTHDEEGRELLFPGGPTIDEVEEWKSRYNGQVYLTEFDNGVFIWRTLKRKEYKEIMKIQGADQFYKEERIAERCVLWPSNYGFASIPQGEAGIPTLLSELIMEKSGFQARTGAMKL